MRELTFAICAEPKRVAALICAVLPPRTDGSSVGSGRVSMTIVTTSVPEAPFASVTVMVKV